MGIKGKIAWNFMTPKVSRVLFQASYRELMNLLMSTSESVDSINFKMKDIGFRVVVIVAVVILLIILIDQIYLRKRREIKELDKERQKLEEKMGTSGEAPDLRFTGREGELMGLKKEKTQFEYMINLTNIKYHTRKLDEESFREIVRDYQKKLIEIEIKIKELEREKEKSRE